VVRYSFNTFNHSAWLGRPPSLPEQIDAAAAAGYEHVGLDMPSIRAHAESGLEPEALAARIAAAGLTPYELTFVTIVPDADATRASLEEALDLVGPIQPTYVQCLVTGPPDECVGTAREVGTALADRGVGLAIEYLPNIPVRSIADTLYVIDRVGLPSVRVCVDTFHFFHGPDTWDDLDTLPSEQLAFVQFDDAPTVMDAGDPSLGAAMMDHRVLPGEGVFELDEFARHLEARGFDGVVSVEVLSAEWRDRPLDEFARASLAATKAFFGNA
jgi:sugar phosphate isomerase/epimerase